MNRALLISLALTIALAVPAGAPASTPRLVGAVNAERAERGLAPLKSSRSLTGSSRRYAGFLMRRDLFRHPGRLWIARRFSLRGETLALHRLRAPARQTVAAWLRSPAHRGVLLHPAMRYAGAGQARGDFAGGRAVIRVLHTARQVTATLRCLMGSGRGADTLGRRRTLSLPCAESSCSQPSSPCSPWRLPTPPRPPATRSAGAAGDTASA